MKTESESQVTVDKELLQQALDALEGLDAALEAAWDTRRMPASVISAELVMQSRAAIAALRTATSTAATTELKG